MRSLERVQRVAKIVEIIVKILFVICVIGVVCCVLGTMGFLLVGKDSGAWAQINQNTQIKVSYEECLCACLVGTVLCAGETVLYYYVKKFYKMELEVGTPFDKRVVKEMRRIALLHITIPLGASVVAMIVMLILGVQVADINMVDLSMGLMYFVLSLVFDYGADLRQIEIETVKIREEVLGESEIKNDETIVVEPQEERQERVVKRIEVTEEKPLKIRKRGADKSGEVVVDEEKVAKERKSVQKEKVTKPQRITTVKKEGTKRVAKKDGASGSQKDIKE